MDVRTSQEKRRGTFGIDLYQITTLLTHAAAGRIGHREAMAFFFRRLPKNRNYVVFSGLCQILEHAAEMEITPYDVAKLYRHPMLGPALAKYPEVADLLMEIKGFEGTIDALPEGTLAFAGPGYRTDGTPLLVNGSPVNLYDPLIQIDTDLPRAKLVETPWLSRINYLSAVASKAARVVSAAAGRPVLEFGTRRTHPDAALDAAWAAHVAGCAATSNIAAWMEHGIPCAGTMDHFAVQASEVPDVPVTATERAFFAAFADLFPDASTLLVDTYDAERGIVSAARATGGKLNGIRLDSNVNTESVKRARALLDANGARDAKIFASDGLDEYKIAALLAAGAPVDGFGVGENITFPTDAGAGIGAVGKLVENGYGKVTMKLAKGSGKATLPGRLQAYRFPGYDLIALADEPAPAGGVPLLRRVWEGKAPTKAAAEATSLPLARKRTQEAIAALPNDLRGLELAREGWKMVASDKLAAEIERLAKEAE